MSAAGEGGRSQRPEKKLFSHAVILAGGRGTRFWPRSRISTPKQLLNIVSDEVSRGGSRGTGRETMLAQTIERLSPLFQRDRIWVVTNREQAGAVGKAAPRIPRRNIVAEPTGRNTAAAIGLAAFHLMRREGSDALMAVLPADHFIAHPQRYRQIVRAALEVAARPGALVVLGIPPTRPETGYGYVERAVKRERIRGDAVYLLRQFTEKPKLALARRYLASGRHLWNAGMFFWRASTFLANLERHLPKTHAALRRLSETIGTSRYEAALRRIYPQLDNISVDYAVLEPASREPKRSPVYVLPAEVGWSDIGSWEAVYELLARGKKANVSAGKFAGFDAAGNFIWSPRKFSAALGVENVILVDTDDALLLCSRDRAQEVGRVVKWLEAHRMRKLL